MKRPLILLLALTLGAGAHAERAFDLFKRSGFRQAHLAALGSLKAERWVAQLPGPAGEVVNQTVDGVDYLLADSCKPHDCSEENLVLAFAPAKSKVFVLLNRNGQRQLLGEPPANVSQALEKVYAERFKKP